MALYGLRPAEAGCHGTQRLWRADGLEQHRETQQADDDEPATAPGQLLRCPGQEGEAEKLWDSYKAGLVKLPPSLVRHRPGQAHSPVQACGRLLPSAA